MGDNVRIMCPNLTCRRVLIVPTSSRGKTVRCRNCGITIRVPEKSMGAVLPPDAAAAAGAAPVVEQKKAG